MLRYPLDSSYSGLSKENGIKYAAPLSSPTLGRLTEDISAIHRLVDIFPSCLHVSFCWNIGLSMPSSQCRLEFRVKDVAGNKMLLNENFQSHWPLQWG